MLLKLTNMCSQLNYLTRMYRMDFDRKTGTFRMLDNILPDVSPACILHEASSMLKLLIDRLEWALKTVRALERPRGKAATVSPRLPVPFHLILGHRKLPFTGLPGRIRYEEHTFSQAEWLVDWCG